jgi:hypothetical protein
LNSPAPPLSFISPPCIPGIVSTGNTFHLLTCVHSNCTLLHLSPPPSPPTGTNSPKQDLFHPPALWKTIWHFCLFKIAIQGDSLWHFHVYMYYNMNWFISSIFLLSPLISFLW